MFRYTRGGYDAFPFTSHCGLVLSGRACADGQREKAHCRGATGDAANVPERRSERLTGFRPSGPTGHAYVVVDERHIHHVGALVDRKSTRLNSSHANISYAVFCLKKKKTKQKQEH